MLGAALPSRVHTAACRGFAAERELLAKKVLSPRVGSSPIQGAPPLPSTPGMRFGGSAAASLPWHRGLTSRSPPAAPSCPAWCAGSTASSSGSSSAPGWRTLPSATRSSTTSVASSSTCRTGPSPCKRLRRPPQNPKRRPLTVLCPSSWCTEQQQGHGERLLDSGTIPSFKHSMGTFGTLVPGHQFHVTPHPGVHSNGRGTLGRALS